jgi:site-specific recombinase XerD
LNEAGVDDKDIQSILRYADVSTTQAYYVLPNRERAQAGMMKLDKTLRIKYGIKG